jgi:CheY-like chemotaxis protein
MGDPPLADPKGKTVLVVDDDEAQRDLIKYMLRKEGFQVVEADNGALALRQAVELLPDAIILDLMLPGMSGYEVVRQLQAAGSGAIPVIIVTAREMDRKAEDALRVEPNVRDLLQKPPRPAALSACLHALLMTRPPEPS